MTRVLGAAIENGKYPRPVKRHVKPTPHYACVKSTVNSNLLLFSFSPTNQSASGPSHEKLKIAKKHLNCNNAITDGGVALPKFPLTIVMKFSNFKSLRISRNSKDFKKANIGSWRVRNRPSRLRRLGRY